MKRKYLCQHVNGRCAQCGQPMEANWVRPCKFGDAWPMLPIDPLVASPIQPLVRFVGDGTPKPKAKHDRACKYVGKGIKVKTGCSGATSGSVWECTNPKLPGGKCAPLDILPLAVSGCVTCALCQHYEAAADPGYIQLGLEFASAIAKWVTGGRKVRTQEQVDKLLKVCLSCPFIARSKDGSTWCGKCGCPVNNMTDDPIMHRNKLVMLSETCPADPPMWTDELPADEGKQSLPPTERTEK